MIMNQNDFAFCESLVRQAGAGLHARCVQTIQPPLSRAAAFKVFQEVNSQVEAMLKAALAERFPSIHWSSSEFRPDQQQQPEFDGTYWVCDAIDGAIHFLQGFGFYSTTLCLIQGGKPVLAYVYDPERDELFHAIAGQGAFLNGRRMKIASKTKLTDAYVTTSPPSFPAKEPLSTELAIRSSARMMMQAFAVKMLGSVKLQLAYVACGRLDGYWEYGSEYGDYYDWLPGALLVQEAGGMVMDTEGDSFTWGTKGIIAGNEAISRAMVEKLKGIRNK